MRSRKRSHRTRPFQLLFEAGSFSPHTIGVQIRVPKTLGPLLGVVLESLRHQFDDPGDVDPLDEGNLNLAQRHGKLFDVLAYSSVVIHEMRHFHEYLATAYGSRVMFDHLLLASLTAPVQRSLEAEDAIAVPITSWAAMPASNYKEYAKQVRPSTLRRRPPELTSRLIELAQPVIGSIGFLGALPVSHHADFKEFQLSFMQLLEAGPMTCQISHLGETVGASRAGEFCENLRLRDGSRTYTQPWNLWFTLEKQLGLPSHDPTAPGVSHVLRNAVTFYCLSGRKANDSTGTHHDVADAVHASDVFVLLWSDLLQTGVPADGEIIGWLDERARHHNLLTLSETLEMTVARTQQWAVDLADWPNATGIGPVVTPNLVEFFRLWAKAQQHLCRWIHENPLSFFDPKRYRESLADLVAAAYIVESDADTEPWYTVSPGPTWDDGDQPFAHLRAVQSSVNATLGPVGAQGWRAAVWPVLSPGNRFIAIEDLWAVWAEVRAAANLWMLPTRRPERTYTKTIRGVRKLSVEHRPRQEAKVWIVLRNKAMTLVTPVGSRDAGGRPAAPERGRCLKIACGVTQFATEEVIDG